MSYPPPQGGYPYPTNQGGLGNVGFSSPSQPGQGPGYSLYPQESGGFPCPPSNPAYPAATSYNLAPGGSSPYPASSNSSIYPPLSNSPTPYSLQSSPYPPVQGSSPYPPAPGSAPYPPAPGSAPYPPAPGSAPYPPAPGSAPYPPAPGSSPYPPAPGSSPYPPAPGSSPYPPAPGSSPYPPAPGSAPYPPAAGPSYPPSSSSAPYSSSAGSAPYPPGYGSGQHPSQSSAPQSSPYPPAGYPYPPGSGTSGSSPAHQSPGTYSQQFSHGGIQGVMWPYQERPTLRPSMSFDASSDAAQLRKAMKGFGTDEATIIRILGRRTSQQRQEILLRYQQSYGKDLVKDLKSELSGQFENTIVAVMTPLPTFLAQQLNKAMSGIGTRESTLIEILCANDNNTIRSVKAAYQFQFRKPLEADLRGDTSGYFGRLMVAMATGNRDEMNTDASLAPGLAQSLYSAGVKKFGTDEAEFSRIMSVYSYPVLRCVFDEYRKISGKTFESAIKSELSGDYKDAMLALYECINNRASFFAHYLNLAMRGLGTQDESLIRIIVSRSEIDMGNIKDEYQRKYGKRLEDAVASEASGDYKKVLLALIQG